MRDFNSDALNNTAAMERTFMCIEVFKAETALPLHLQRFKNLNFELTHAYTYSYMPKNTRTIAIPASVT